MTTIVVRLMPNHPTGKRNRAGFTFTEAPIAVDVTEEQLQAIKDDRYLKIITSGVAYEQGLNNAYKQNMVDDNNVDENTSENLTKAEIIEMLVAKGYKEKEDFNSTAREDVLLELLNA